MLRTRRAKVCDLCGKPYYRRSLTETWDRQNPGSRTGWHKTVYRACTTCITQERAQRMMILAPAPIRLAPRRKRTMMPRLFIAAFERARTPAPVRAIRPDVVPDHLPRVHRV